MRRYGVAIGVGDPCVGLQDLDASDTRVCDASTCDADVVIVGFDEQRPDVRCSAMILQHTDDVMPLPRACADDANRARGASSIASLRRRWTAIRRCERSDPGSSYA